MTLNLLDFTKDDNINDADVPEQVICEVNKNEYPIMFNTWMVVDKEKVFPQQQQNQDEAEREMFNNNNNDAESGKYEFQTSNILNKEEWKNYDTLKDNARYAIGEDEAMGILKKTTKGAYYKFIFAHNGSTFEGAIVEVIDITNNNNKNSYRLKIIYSTNDVSMSDNNNLIELPNDFSKIDILKMKQINRPLVKLPEFYQHLPMGTNAHSCRYVLYVSARRETLLNSRNSIGAAAIVLHDRFAGNKMNDNVIIQKYFAGGIDNDRTVKLLALEGAARLNNLILRNFNHNNTQVLVVVDDSFVFQVATNNPRIFDPHHQSIRTNIRNMFGANVQYALLNNKGDSYNPASTVCKATMDTARTVCNVIRGHEIITESQQVINRRNNLNHLQQNANNNIAANAQHVDQSLSIEEWVKKIDSFEKFTQLNRFKTKSKVNGTQIRREWGSLIKMLTVKVRNATEVGERSFWMRALIFAPHMMLPIRSTPDQIIKHLMSNKPFNIEFSSRDIGKNNNNNQNQNQQQRNIKRTAERVSGLAKDHKLRKAVNLMMQDADAAVMNNNINQDGSQQQPVDPEDEHDEKVANLRSKFPPMQEENEVEKMLHIVTRLEGKLVYQTVKNSSRSATTAIDGWTRDLMMAAMTVDHSIAEDLGDILAMIASSVKHDEQQEAINNNNNIPHPAANNNSNSRNGRNNNNNNNINGANNTLNQKNWCRYFDDLTMDIIRGARLVGIKKSCRNFRPIVISSFFAKIAGASLLKRAGIGRNYFKYNLAISTPNATKFIGYKARKAFEEGKAIVKIDLCNGYNETQRKKILEQMKKENIDSDLVSYFTTMYRTSSKLAIYGPRNRVDIVEASEGVRQGDAPSSFFFCLVMEEVCRIIKEQYPNDADAEILCYMDDSTIICEPSIVRRVIQCAIDAARQCGFRVNVEKSSVICKNGIPAAAAEEEQLEMITINNENEEFKMLGQLINNNPEAFESYNNNIIARIDRFFDSLEEVGEFLHPELVHQIIMMCGRPRLLYYCETTQPKFGTAVVQHFQHRMKAAFAKLIDIADLNTIRDEMLYDFAGACLPNYARHYEEIYVKSTTMVSTGNMGKLMVKLIDSNLENFTSPECLLDRHWTQYKTYTRITQLDPRQYKYALAIRCKLIPDGIRDEIGNPVIRCICKDTPTLLNKNLTAEEERELMNNNKNNNNDDNKNNRHEILLQHVMSCQEIQKMHYNERHNYVRDALRSIARSYGIESTPEPNFYTYESGQRCRPDITFNLPSRNKLTIDVTVVQPSSNRAVTALGEEAARAAAEKLAKHNAAVAAMNHEFVPFAVESHGFMDRGCFYAINKLKGYVAFESRFDFARDMKSAVSTALAKYRAEVLTYVLTHVSLNKKNT